MHLHIMHLVKTAPLCITPEPNSIQREIPQSLQTSEPLDHTSKSFHVDGFRVVGYG